MSRPRIGDVLAAARFELRPLRRAVSRCPARGHLTWNVQLGPVPIDGHTVHLRSPRLDDGDQWCASRLRHRALIEPWWVTSELSWEERHTRDAWVSHYLQLRRAARVGKAFPLVADVDGVVVGELSLEWIDHYTSSAEVGGWLDPDRATGRLALVAMASIVDYAFGALGLQRVTAPICVGNRAASLLVRRVGLRPEGIMAGYLDVGGRRADHQLFAATADRRPLDGFLARALEFGSRAPRPEPAPIPAPAPAG